MDKNKDHHFNALSFHHSEADVLAIESLGIDLSEPGVMLVDWDGSVFPIFEELGKPSNFEKASLNEWLPGFNYLDEINADIGNPISHVIFICSIERLDYHYLPHLLFSLSKCSVKFITIITSGEPNSRRLNLCRIPTHTWTELLNFSGFDFLGSSHLSLDVDAGRDPVTRAWRCADLFHDDPYASYISLKFRNNIRAIDGTDVVSLSRRVLDLDYLDKKVSIRDLRYERIIFNIHHLQDYSNLSPVFDIFDKSNIDIFVREGSEISLNIRRLIQYVCDSKGIRCTFYRRVADLDWNRIRGVTVISASECNVWLSHALSRQFIETARSFGAKTFLLQHGVWLDSSGGIPVSFGSDAVLCWGSEHETSLQEHSTSFLGVGLETPSTAHSRFEVVGSPKFADARVPGHRSMLAKRLGVPMQGYRGVALVGTNFHWWVHGGRKSFDKAISQLRDDHPDWLFVLKPHPRETLQEYEHLRASNLTIIDDAIGVMLDIPISRLVACADVVVSSLSSLLIDAAVAEKPVFQYETGSEFSYRGISARPIGELSKYLENPPELEKLINSELAANYAEGDHDSFYARFKEIIENKKDDFSSSSSYVGAYSIIENSWLEKTSGDLAICDIDLLNNSGLFDAEFYKSQLDESSLRGLEPIEHFLTIGGWRLLDPRPSFSSAWYRSNIGNLGAVAEIPVLHYLRSGCHAGLSPHPLVRADWIRGQLDPDMEPPNNLLRFYLEHGDRLGVSPCPLFSPEWYLGSNPDLAGVPSSLEHYLVNGWREGRSPHPSFSADNYLTLNPDVAESVQNPLLHYVQYGVYEQRKR